MSERDRTEGGYENMLIWGLRLYSAAAPLLSRFGSSCIIFLCLGPALGWAQNAGKVVSVTGKVLARNENQAESTRTLKPGAPLYAGDILNTPSNGAVKLLMDDKSMVDLGASALFKVDEYRPAALPADRKVQLSLSYGKIRVAVNSPVGKAGKFSVKTRSAVMGVRGTEFVVLSDLESFIQPPAPPKTTRQGETPTPSAPAAAKTQITVIHGKVEVDAETKNASGETKKTSVALTEGTQMTTGDSEKSSDGKESSEPRVTRLSKEEIKEVQQEAKQQDKTFTRAVAVDTANGGGEQTLADIASEFSLPTDFVPQISDLRLPGAFGLDLWVFNPTTILNSNVLNQGAVSNVKVVFSP